MCVSVCLFVCVRTQVGIPSILSAAPVAGGPMYYFVTLVAEGGASGTTGDSASLSQVRARARARAVGGLEN